MKKRSLKDIGLDICVSYTFISIGIHLWEMFSGYGTLKGHMKVFSMFFCTIVAVLILSLYQMLEDWPPLILIIFQYVLAMAIILGTLYLLNPILEVAPGGYQDMWRSFTIIYVIGAAVYYIEIYLSIKRQNKWLKDAKQSKV
ncbi:MAG: hypothetical protein E7231_12570 [Cellulosilyticum sp.]|nr:hypothetical protein [Cellulosilyticum sp.]